VIFGHIQNTSVQKYGPNLPDFCNSFHKVAKKYQQDS